ncbi:MAG: RNase adapter RapZ [Eggerthellaceae bacterium]|nr:RNase adapter RapZ [Eggerthellaceae bacterium]
MPESAQHISKGEHIDLVIITGMSGAGRTEAMHTFEDLGYYCIDNLPPSLLLSLVSSSDIPGQGEGRPHLAVVCDARNRDYFEQLSTELNRLHEQGIEYRIIFLDASDDELLARYKASRRRHPLCTDNKMTLAQGIDAERILLSDLRQLASMIIDTSSLKPIELRERINETFSESSPQDGLGVVVYSFGFKHGMAEDADIVIDVRFLPNPYYDPNMRYMTGLEDEVRNFVMERNETREFLKNWEQLLDCVMPGYIAEGKQQLAIGIGCTGGQHRSVVLAEATGQYLRSRGYRVHVSHRDLSLADTKGDGGDNANTL